MISLKKYQIFGERNSGTTYLKQVLDANFKLECTSEYGFKHWFIKDHQPRGRPNSTTDNECLRSLDDSEDTLFIFIVRDPIGWLQSMHKKPYHAPEHKNLSFGSFIRKKWICYEKKCPSVHIPGKSMTPWNKKLNEPYYFIEESANICTLRNEKNAHFLSLKDRVKHFFVIRLDRLLEDIWAMALELNLETKLVEITLPEYRKPNFYGEICQEDLGYIKQELNLELEISLGFKIQ